MDYIVNGGKKLSGSISVNTSKNATVAMIVASLLNKGTTTLKRIPKIEEVKRLIEVIQSIGAIVVWDENKDLHITPPESFSLQNLNIEAAAKTRSIAMFIAPLAHKMDSFRLPIPGGCNLGKRTLGPHFEALQMLGINVSESKDGRAYEIVSGDKKASDIIMYEASDTGVETVIMAAALIPGKTTIRFCSANYMVQDLCVFLQNMGVRIDGIGTSDLTVYGIESIDDDVVGFPAEDPIEAMFFVSLAAITKSEIKIDRAPISFLELELFTLKHMGLCYETGKRYLADNNHALLADIILHPSELFAPPEKIAPRPYPGINIDNLPFFVPIAALAKGETLIHDWVYDGRAKYYTALNGLGANIEQLDVHRVLVGGGTKFHCADIEAPPALRPATLLLAGMLAAEGKSTLRNVYHILRGYENLHGRLAGVGASIELVG